MALFVMIGTDLELYDSSTMEQKHGKSQLSKTTAASTLCVTLKEHKMCCNNTVHRGPRRMP